MPNIINSPLVVQTSNNPMTVRMVTKQALGVAVERNNTGGGGGGTSNYPDLTNKPQINGVTLVGNKSPADLGLTSSEVFEIDYSDPPADADIFAAVAAGKVVYVKRTTAYQTYYFYLTRIYNSGKSLDFGASYAAWDGSAWIYYISSIDFRSEDTPKWKGTTVSIPRTADVGDLSDLDTTDKSSLVAAINELYGEKVAWVTYGTSTSAEIDAAYQAGKVVICKRVVSGSDFFFFLIARNSATAHVFGNIGAWTQNGTTVLSGMGCQCTNDVWTGANYTLAKADDIGDLSNLTTTAKNNLVAAINELVESPPVTAQQVQEAVDNYIDDHPVITGTFSNAAKNALLALLEKVAYLDDDAQNYLDALEAALFTATLTSITAVFTQGSNIVYDTDSLDSLKSMLVVTATYSDNSTAIIPSSGYTLSGTLTEGTSTITVSYGGKTATFNVTVTASASLSSISAVFTQGQNVVYDIDNLDSLKSMLVVTATYSDSSTATVPSTDYTLSGTLSTGTSTITVSYGGKSTTFNVTVTSYIQYSYSYANGDLEKVNGASIWRDTYHLAIGATSGAVESRRVFPRDYGVRSYHYTTDEVNFTDTSSYYPIPVPSDATQVTVSITPATQYHAETFYVLENGEYTRTNNPGWKQGSFTHTFAAGTYEYMSINCKYDSNGSSYPVEPTNLTILFE